MKKVMMGNHALSYGAMLARAQVVSAYPITPQTQVVELLSEMCADGTLEAQFIKVESEHSAMASCIGASVAGARAFTATSSQGLALMHEMLHWAGGGRHPIVMGEVNRAMAPGWSIWTDQNDSLSQRDTGWMQFYCSSNQEVVDTVIQAFKVAETLMIPAMVILDAFALSHTYEVVDVPEQALVDKYLPPFKPAIRLNPADPRAFGGLTGSEHYMELRYKLEKDMEKAPALIEETGREYEKLFGRRLGLIDAYRCDDADFVFVTSGTAGYTARVAVDELRASGVKAGNLRIKVFRPFPYRQVREVLGRVKKAAVLDRNCSYGAGGIFYQEVKSAVYSSPGMPPIFGYIAGLGGRDIMTDSFKEIAAHAASRDRADEEIVWIGVKK
ncbi:MAG TPA: pyruvate ferredoxin oxidoreductase [Candidatus Aminicenantes bacterium]|nr:pyruvate ferredoxin oxidoreductase [Candidatus Aminicenantes bacterium]HRY64473.1 pyruvate ferredoxin oxidoreductase [Candidatus Aminicenantes bacterium]HRZ71386.1 pyruvate ferredoxin oxidoreductase [Candidatus Aminicenantes bacterium]